MFKVGKRQTFAFLILYDSFVIPPLPPSGPASAFARVRDAMRSVGVPEVDGKMAELGVDVLRAVVAKLSQPGAVLPVLYHALHVREKERQSRSLPLDDCHAILKFLSDNMEAVRQYYWVF